MKYILITVIVTLALTSPAIHAVEPEDPIVVFDTDFALPAMPTGDGTGTPVCIDLPSGLVVAGCDAAVGPQGPQDRYYGESTFQVGDANGAAASTVRHSAINDYVYAPAAQGATYFQAALDIPNGATITGLTCYRFDNDDTNDQTNYVAVRRRDLTSTSSSPYLVVSSSSTSGTSTSIQSISSTGTLAIDYSAYAYWLYMYSVDFGGSSNIRFYGCRVAYTLSAVSQ